MNQQHTRSPKRRQRGQMGIVGVVIGIALLALVIYGVVKFLGSGRAQHNATAEATNLTSMVANAQKLYNGVPTGYQNVNDTVLIQNGAVPAGNVNGTNIESSFGTPVTVAGVDLGTITNGGIQVTYAVPQASCADFAKAIASNVNIITVGGTTVKDTTGTTGANSTIDPTTLGTSCQVTTNGNVAIVATAGL